MRIFQPGILVSVPPYDPDPMAGAQRRSKLFFSLFSGCKSGRLSFADFFFQLDCVDIVHRCQDSMLERGSAEGAACSCEFARILQRYSQEG